MDHHLKTQPAEFNLVWEHDLTFQMRKDDRQFRCGDFVYLTEFDSASRTFSGRVVFARVGVVLRDFPGIEKGYCVFSLISPQRFGRRMQHGMGVLRTSVAREGKR